MKYDDASWHYGGDYPKGLPNENGATHIGMFVAWCMLNGLAGELHVEDGPEELEKLRNREETPGQWFINNCDEKFTEEDLSDEGNQFAVWYYEADDAPFYNDYTAAVDPEEKLETLYHAQDSWDSYDRLAPLVTTQFQKWKARSS